MVLMTLKSLAGIGYAGTPGSLADCGTAVLQRLFHGDRVASVKILTHVDRHCILLMTGTRDVVAIKSGFASGYLGEGPSAFSFVLNVLMSYGLELAEYDVPAEVLERLDASALTDKDLKMLEDGRPVRPMRLYEYCAIDSDKRSQGTLFSGLEPRLPLALIDSRIIDLAIHFEEQPDSNLLTGYRRLEDLVRERSGICGAFGAQ